METIPADHPVYLFLKEMNIKGVLKEYNDVVLPLSKQEVIAALEEIEDNSASLTGVEKEYLERMKEKFLIKEATSLFSSFPESFFKDSQKHLYSYNDSIINFYIDPVLDYTFLYYDLFEDYSHLFNYGGRVHGTYDNWLGFNLQGSQGVQNGSRDVARLDKRVAQSFTFNDTELNYFDDTEGYLRLQKGIVSLQAGRETQLWGTGYIDKLYISDNSQKFDFIKFGASYKSLSYTFIHSWLVHPTDTTFVDTVQQYVKNKPSKYLAISRIGFQPNRSISIGISQIVIYSHRPFEAAYLNPFLFWESAQRSLNDLDNSMLAVDGKFIITDGLELAASMVFDDIKFENWFNGNWSAAQNRTAWQAGIMLTDPLLVSNVSLKLEYMQLRPYVYSHYGMTESALTYTNNGYSIGTDLEPNSTRFSVEVNYRPLSKVNLNFLYKHSLHGRNIYGKNGEVVKNVGGDIYRPVTIYDSEFAELLDGEKEKTNFFRFKIDYEVRYGIYLQLLMAYETHAFRGMFSEQFWFRGGLSLRLE